MIMSLSENSSVIETGGGFVPHVVASNAAEEDIHYNYIYTIE